MDAVVDHEISVRYRDLDTYGHVNNAVYATYCEQARNEWIATVLDVHDVDDLSVVLANLELNFRRTVTGQTRLRVETGLVNLGTSSFTLGYRIRDDDGVVADGETTQVRIDTETTETEPMPTEWHDRIESYRS